MNNNLLSKFNAGRDPLCEEIAAIAPNVFVVNDENVSVYKKFYDLVSSPPKSDYQTGLVISKNDREIMVDTGGKHDILVRSSKYEIGDEVELIVSENTDDYIVGSVSDAKVMRVKDELTKAVGTNKFYEGRVIDMIKNGGYYVDVGGLKCFMPGSHASMNKLWDFSSVIGKKLMVVPLNRCGRDDMVVVSHKKYLDLYLDEYIKNIECNRWYTGNVTDTKDFGIFVQFGDKNCATGLIHKNNLDEETEYKFYNNEIEPGDEISFLVNDIRSKYKINLSQIW